MQARHAVLTDDSHPQSPSGESTAHEYELGALFARHYARCPRGTQKRGKLSRRSRGPPYPVRKRDRNKNVLYQVRMREVPQERQELSAVGVLGREWSLALAPF